MDVATIAQILSALGILLGLLYAAAQLRHASEVHEQDLRWKRMHAAEQVMLSFKDFVGNHEPLDEALAYTDGNGPIPLKKVLKAFEKDRSLRLTCHTILNYFETLAIGIGRGIYDEETIRRAWQGNMERTYDAFSEYVEHYRAEGRPRAFVEQQALLERWSRTHGPWYARAPS